MKTIKIFALAVFVIGSAFTPITLSKQTTENPAKTAFIKHPGAEDTKVFFSTTTTLLFEVYKVGSKEDISKILTAFRNDGAVESITEGKLTGDYQAFSLKLNTAKNKEWFAKTFKKAGLNTIHINNHPTVPVEKM